jgi:lipopolysaccharide export system permease protein
MKPVIVVSILLSIGAFYFSNRVIPVSYKKLIALMASIRQMRPEIVIKEGVFSNDIDNFSIKVGRKSKDASMLYDIMIYDHRNDRGNETVTLADSGTMKITTDKRFMILTLYSGETHEEIQSDNKAVRGYPSRTDKFIKQTLNSKLQGMELERKDESIFRNQYRALNNKQLQHFVDSISKQVEISSFESSLAMNYPPPIGISLRAIARKDTAFIPKMRLHRYVDIDSVMANTNLPVREQCARIAAGR